MKEKEIPQTQVIQFSEDCEIHLKFVGIEKEQAKYSNIYTYYDSEGRNKVTITAHYKIFDDRDRDVFKEKIALDKKKSKEVKAKLKQRKAKTSKRPENKGERNVSIRGKDVL